MRTSGMQVRQSRYPYWPDPEASVPRAQTVGPLLSVSSCSPLANPPGACSANLCTARFRAAHDPADIQRFWTRAKLPAWDALEAQFRKGPPPFLRPGWISPLLGKQVDLGWLDTGTFVPVQGDMKGWRDAKLLVIEIWAS